MKFLDWIIIVVCQRIQSTRYQCITTPVMSLVHCNHLIRSAFQVLWMIKLHILHTPLNFSWNLSSTCCNTRSQRYLSSTCCNTQSQRYLSSTCCNTRSQRYLKVFLIVIFIILFLVRLLLLLYRNKHLNKCYFQNLNFIPRSKEFKIYR